MSTVQPNSSSIIEIRPITIDDYNDWIVLLDAFNLFYKVRFEPNLIATTWQRLIDPNERIYGVIAWIDKKAVGFAHWLFHRSTWAISDYCQLADLFVSEDARCGGIGRKLIDHVIADARKNSASRVHWMTHETNETAQRLYDKYTQRSGFISYRVHLQEHYINL